MDNSEESSKASESFEDLLEAENSSSDDASTSDEILDPMEKITIEGPVENIKIDAPVDETIKVDIIPDELASPEDSEEEEEETDDESEEEVPQIIIKKTIITSDDKEFISSSSETPDMIINPFLVTPEAEDVEEVIKPDVVDEDKSNFDSNEIDFNLIDSNDVTKSPEPESGVSPQIRAYFTRLFKALGFLTE